MSERICATHGDTLTWEHGGDLPGRWSCRSCEVRIMREVPSGPPAAPNMKHDPKPWSCGCDDDELHRMQALMARGMSQREASLRVWGAATEKEAAA